MGDCGKSISDLSPEILEMIFTFYVESEGHAALYTIVANVSRTWRKLALSENLWKEVSFITEDFRRGYSWLKDKDVLERFSVLKTLDFKYISGSNDICTCFLVSRLGKFDAVKCPCIIRKREQTNELFGTTLKHILSNSKNLQNINLKHTQDMPIPHFLHDLPILCPKMTEIQIEEMNFSSDEEMLYTWIEKYNTKLTRLIMRRISIKRFDAINYLSAKIAECCPNLTNFELDQKSESIFDPGSLFDLNAFQLGCPKIKEFCLRNVILEDDDLALCFPHLEKFYYALYHFPFNIEADITSVLRGSEGLKELGLIGLNLKAETIFQLPCKFLKKLSFSHEGDNTHDLYDILCHWKHSLTEIDALCNECSQLRLLYYIDQYGKDNLESLTIHSLSPQITNIKMILKQCKKLRFLHITNIECFGEEPTLLLNTREKIGKWLLNP